MKDFSSVTDFSFTVSGPKIRDCGEDSFFFALNSHTALAAVCDGCGGSGARRYPAFQGKTGAYLAARIVAGTIRDAFEAGEFRNSPEQTVGLLQEKFRANLHMAKNLGGTAGHLKGSLAKEFPSTLAALTCCRGAGGTLKTSCYWAGDSRCYLLTPDGLMQLTEDDVDSGDAMDNLTADGTLKNLISLSGAFAVHTKTLAVSLPAVLFAATDGCFAYYRTPMEFEYLLLHCLETAENPEGWENAIRKALREVAGDDFTLTGFALGFKSFDRMKNSFKGREAEVSEQYIRKLEGLTRDEMMILWKQYRETYSRYLKPDGGRKDGAV